MTVRYVYQVLSYLQLNPMVYTQKNPSEPEIRVVNNVVGGQPTHLVFKQSKETFTLQQVALMNRHKSSPKIELLVREECTLSETLSVRKPRLIGYVTCAHNLNVQRMLNKVPK
jgi:hypothetical protein